MQKFVPRSRVGIFRNERTRSTPLDPKLTFWCISYYLCAFGTVWLPYETRCKTGRTSAKVCATKSRRNFSHERIRSTPLHRKLTFSCILYNLGAFVTVWLPYETRCKTGRSSAKLRATKCVGIFCNEHIQSTPLHRKLTFSCVLHNLGAFVIVWLPYETQCKTGQNGAKGRATKGLRNFSQRMHLIHPIGP